MFNSISAAKFGDMRVTRRRDEAHLSWDQISFKLLKLIRCYTFNSPVRRGKLRLSRMSKRLWKHAPDDIMMTASDGRRFCMGLSSGLAESIFFLGEYERAVTRVICDVVGRKDICLDAGANVGWYTTLLSQLSGTGGAVHAFEPSPKIFAVLKKNIGLVDDASSIHINNLALGDVPGRVMLHVFPDLPHGHTSLSPMGRTDVSTVETEMVTLDSYLEKQRLRQVDFIKVDIEGAELMFFRGGARLFEQDVPPIFMIEMALGTTKGFDYLPNDLIVFLRERADYEFYAVDEISMTLQPIKGFAPDDIGANVLCLPAPHYGEKIALVRKKIDALIAA